MLFNYKKELRKFLVNETILGNGHSIPLDKVVEGVEGNKQIELLQKHINQEDIPRLHSLLFSKPIQESIYQIAKEKLWNNINNINEAQTGYCGNKPEIIANFTKRVKEPQYKAYWVKEDLELVRGHDINTHLKRYCKGCILYGNRYNRKGLILERKDIKINDKKDNEFGYNTSLIVVGGKPQEGNETKYELESITGRLNHGVNSSRIPDMYLSKEELNTILMNSDFNEKAYDNEMDIKLVIDSGKSHSLYELSTYDLDHYRDLVNGYLQWKNNPTSLNTTGTTMHYRSSEVMKYINPNEEGEFIENLVKTVDYRNSSGIDKVLDSSNKNKLLLLLWRNKQQYNKVIDNIPRVGNFEPFKSEKARKDKIKAEKEAIKQANKDKLLERMGKLNNIVKNKTSLLNGLKYNKLNIDEIILQFTLEKDDIPYTHLGRLLNSEKFINNNIDKIGDNLIYCYRYIANIEKHYKERVYRKGDLSEIFGDSDFTRKDLEMMESVIDIKEFFKEKNEYDELSNKTLSDITITKFKRFKILQKTYKKFEQISNQVGKVFEDYKQYKNNRYLMVIDTPRPKCL